jgi:hypothetical protein
MSTFHTSILRGDEEIDLEVEYTAWKASRGARDSINGVKGAGPPLEPDEPAGIEIENAIDRETGHAIELTRDEEDRIIGRISEQ